MNPKVSEVDVGTGPAREIIATSVLRPGFLEPCKRDLGSENIPNEVYVSKDFELLEIDRMWSRVWQLACREEDIAHEGDVHVFELGGHSVVIVRVSPTEIRAYHNSCLHRGTLLCERDGNLSHLRCPFHGWTWSLEGELAFLPSSWDFPHVDASECRLPAVNVDTWEGFVFINLDDNPVPLRDYLGILPEHTGRFSYGSLFKAAHLRIVINANWKLTFGAFAEGYHTNATHPQVLGFPMRLHYPATVRGANEPVLTEDPATDVYDGHVIGRWGSRTALAEQVEMKPLELTAAEIFGLFSDPDAVARFANQGILLYWLFPNFAVFGGNFPIIYRVLPYRDDPQMSILDVMLLSPKPTDMPVESAKPQYFDLGDDLRACSLGPAFGVVYDQDVSNLARVQRGLRAAKKPGITLGRTLEAMLRYHHQLLERYLEAGQDA